MLRSEHKVPGLYRAYSAVKKNKSDQLGKKKTTRDKNLRVQKDKGGGF